ncbi:MAG TPA: type II secretion system minor pseudopilin GspK [Casimicrobiaceae bacterium]|jgi:general secretion pathway protein K|nr:type II secretion system minor pseudopilin GspK [Casimicrobiaceae bacterium]
MARAPLNARGAAIVMAMLLAALAATIAAALLWQQQRWAGEYERRRDQVQAQALAMAGVQWARQILFENAPPTLVQLGQPWAFRLPTTPIENGSIGGYITDAQSRLNVNNLANSATVATAARLELQRLFAELGVPNALLNAIADWVDSDDQTTPNGGAEDSYYLAQDPPGLAANAPVRRVAELLAVRGADPTLIARLAPFVDALDAPTPTMVNVNTAPAEVLVAVVGGLGAAGATALVASRISKPFANLGDFRTRLPSGNFDVDESTLTVTSDWFVVTIEARQSDTVARARALLRRSTAPRAWPDVVWQTVE